MSDEDGPEGPGAASGDQPTRRLPQMGEEQPAPAPPQQGAREQEAWEGYGQPGPQQAEQQAYQQQGSQQWGPQGAQQQSPQQWGPQGSQGHSASGQSQFVPAATAFAGQTVQRVRSMPWQERVMRVPGGLAVLAGLFTLLSCLFSWWAVFDRSMGEFVEYSLAPFRGVSVSSGSRWSDMAALNSLDSDQIEALRAVTTYVGALLVVAALCLVAGGLLVALGRSRTLGAALMLLGTVFLGYARLPAEMVGGLADLVSQTSTGLFGPASLLGSELGTLLPEARLGLGLSTFALTLMGIALLIYLGMIIYRESIRIRRWMA